MQCALTHPALTFQVTRTSVSLTRARYFANLLDHARRNFNQITEWRRNWITIRKENPILSLNLLSKQICKLDNNFLFDNKLFKCDFFVIKNEYNENKIKWWWELNNNEKKSHRCIQIKHTEWFQLWCSLRNINKFDRRNIRKVHMTKISVWSFRFLMIKYGMRKASAFKCNGIFKHCYWMQLLFPPAHSNTYSRISLATDKTTKTIPWRSPI